MRGRPRATAEFSPDRGESRDSVHSQAGFGFVPTLLSPLRSSTLHETHDSGGGEEDEKVRGWCGLVEKGKAERGESAGGVLGRAWLEG
jgi:hypothetical protein